MRKSEFLEALRAALGKLPEEETRASLEFYSEAIDDRIEDGASEEDAVAAMGDVSAIASQIEAETPPIPRAVARVRTPSPAANVILAVALSPVWVPLALAFVICVASIYLALWAVVVSLWVVAATLVLCGPIGVAGLAYCIATGFPLTGAWILGIGLFACGLGLLSLPAMRAASVGLARLAGIFAGSVRHLFVRETGRRPIRPEGGGGGPLPVPPRTSGTGAENEAHDSEEVHHDSHS